MPHSQPPSALPCFTAPKPIIRKLKKSFRAANAGAASCRSCCCWSSSVRLQSSIRGRSRGQSQSFSASRRKHPRFRIRSPSPSLATGSSARCSTRRSCAPRSTARSARSTVRASPWALSWCCCSPAAGGCLMVNSKARSEPSTKKPMLRTQGTRASRSYCPHARSSMCS